MTEIATLDEVCGRGLRSPSDGKVSKTNLSGQGGRKGWSDQKGPVCSCTGIWSAALTVQLASAPQLPLVLGVRP